MAQLVDCDLVGTVSNSTVRLCARLLRGSGVAPSGPEYLHTVPDLILEQVGMDSTAANTQDIVTRFHIPLCYISGTPTF